jgi:hypothetical protein
VRKTLERIESQDFLAGQFARLQPDAAAHEKIYGKHDQHAENGDAADPRHCAFVKPAPIASLRLFEHRGFPVGDRDNPLDLSGLLEQRLLIDRDGGRVAPARLGAAVPGRDPGLLRQGRVWLRRRSLCTISRIAAPLAQWAPPLIGLSQDGSCPTQTPFCTSAVTVQPTEQWVQMFLRMTVGWPATRGPPHRSERQRAEPGEGAGGQTGALQEGAAVGQGRAARY